MLLLQIIYTVNLIFPLKLVFHHSLRPLVGHSDIFKLGLFFKLQVIHVASVPISQLGALLLPKLTEFVLLKFFGLFFLLQCVSHRSVGPFIIHSLLEAGFSHL